MNKDTEQNLIDEYFIQRDDKDKLPYEKIKNISHEVLFDFIDEMGLDSLLKTFCIYNDYDLLEKIMNINDFADVNEYISYNSRYKMTLLEIACTHNSYECAKLLICRGSDINRLSYFFRVTPLEKACVHNSYECAKLLIESGADIHEYTLFLSHSHDSHDCTELLTKHGAHE